MFYLDMYLVPYALTCKSVGIHTLWCGNAVMPQMRVQVDGIAGWNSLTHAQQAAVRRELGAPSGKSGNDLAAAFPEASPSLTPPLVAATAAMEQLNQPNEPAATSTPALAVTSFPALPSSAGGSGGSGSNEGGVFVSEFEQQRAELIARNRSRMAQLELPALAATVAPAKPAAAPPKKGLGSSGDRKR
jgi:hypothetical protein